MEEKGRLEVRGCQGIREVYEGFFFLMVVVVGSGVVGRLVAVARIRAQRSGR
jgi:hypothetical protein